ncbi:hypothetical protein [Nocardiopsis quinghaiensis]|uniref:hypothetical protein n=1 Tax=Nocardiopsis quinghaiensis TaxID=464995 RepID=UPI00123B6933|nr:hypothetical protein [Nocardiopsis quinghaiensis]
MNDHPSGRHRRPRQSLAGRVWALTAALLALALAAVFVPQHSRHPRRERAAITPPPSRRELPTITPARGAEGPGTGPEEAESALVRPYMPPFPRVPVGDLLAEPLTAPVRPTPPTEPARDVPDDLGDLADAVRRYLDRVG